MILSFKMALRSISTNKLRAMLTMLGIIIGVAALVVLVSLVSGATTSVTDAVSSIGSDLLTVTISDDKGLPVHLDDLDSWVTEMESVGGMAPSASASVTGKYGADSASFTLYGTTPSYYRVEGLQLALGRFLNRADVENSTRVCVINNAAASNLIGFTDCIDQELSFNGMKYTVIGVLSEEENLLSSMYSGRMIAYIPYTSLQRLSSTLTDDITTFVVSSSDGTPMEQTEEAIKEKLNERFEEDEDAYSVTSMNVMESAMSSITSILSILLGGIAGISLVVGGIGIMNIMLVTVTERTREIGIRKAIGASRGTILMQFLMEAVVLCMLGCAIGIFLSWSILRIAAVVVSSLSIRFTLNGTVVVIAVVFCFLIGVIFGLYPANKAAKMKPIDALHYGG
ncbi:MAG: ABC transporter permease [Oscillospiraceae bacterium]|nr:ABC transporter permease [Oscillospiraceae bacterium]